MDYKDDMLQILSTVLTMVILYNVTFQTFILVTIFILSNHKKKSNFYSNKNCSFLIIVTRTSYCMIRDNVPHNLPILAVQNMLRFQQSDSNPFGMTLKVLRMFCCYLYC